MEWSGTIRQEKRNIFFVPYLTRPHVCRHTYCSNMARSGISVKTLQYLMRHSDISVTLNVYTHLGLADAKREIAQIEQKEQRKIRVKKSRNTAKVANL